MKTINAILLMTAAAAIVTVGIMISPGNGASISKRAKEGFHDWLQEFNRLLRPGKLAQADEKEYQEFI